MARNSRRGCRISSCCRIKAGGKRCPLPKLTGRKIVNGPGSPITSELRAVIFRKGDEQRRSLTLDPVDLASAPGGQALVEYWTCRPAVAAPAPSVEPVQHVTIEYASSRREVVG